MERVPRYRARLGGREVDQYEASFDRVAASAEGRLPKEEFLVHGVWVDLHDMPYGTWIAVLRDGTEFLYEHRGRFDYSASRLSPMPKPDPGAWRPPDSYFEEMGYERLRPDDDEGDS